MNKVIEISDISFGYNSNLLFSNLKTVVYKGDFIGIFGENGSGKTTLVKIILGLLKSDIGQVFWYNDKQKKVSRNKLNIEYISQKAQLIDNLIPITVREVVNMGNKNKSGAFFHFEGKYPFQTTQKALEHTNMLKFIDIPFSNLSGGQKQRVLIAKALISNPDIIVMDEPTSGVDLVAQKHFYDLLEHLNIKHNITIIIVSHDTNFIQEKIKRLWYIGKNNCDECDNRNIHIQNIKKMFSKQEIEFF